MRDLLPLSAYESSVAWNPQRVGIVAGVLFGIPMAMLIWRDDPKSGLGAAVATAAVAAVLFGAFWPPAFRTLMGRLMRPIYEGDSRIVPSPPSGRYLARLMCSLMRGRIAVGGHLYVGPENWVFVPHTRNLRIHREPVRWEQPDRLSISTQPARLGWPGRLLGAEPTDRLVLANGESRDQFVVPDTEHTAAELKRYQHTSPASPVKDSASDGP
jgi:hypothetical protein